MSQELDILEQWLRLGGGAFALVTLAVIFAGIWRGARRQAGRLIGAAPVLLHMPWFYLAASVIFFTFCYLTWRPLPLTLSPSQGTAALAIGALLYFPGMAFVLWGRLALGDMYFVSTGFGAQLFAGHRLVTGGPFAIVRHPMYFGIALAVIGGIFLYQTWTMVLLLVMPLGLARRARVEEQALALELGAQWQEYCQRVPTFFPRWRRRTGIHRSEGDN
jgi:protein-S-isoprenylcysteine O-methyltransferase Ste14